MANVPDSMGGADGPNDDILEPYKYVETRSLIEHLSNKLQHMTLHLPNRDMTLFQVYSRQLNQILFDVNNHERNGHAR